MKKIILGIIVILLVIWATSLISQEKETDGSIKIGAVLSLSGIASSDGESMKEGILFAQKDLAERGIDVEIFIEDDETEIPLTVSALQKMISIHKPDAMIGPTWSFLATAGASILAKEGIPSFQPANTSEFVEVGDAPMFFGNIRVSKKEEHFTKLFRDLGVKRVAVIADNTPWGEAHRLPFTNAAEAVGVDIVVYEEVSFGGGDALPTILTKVKNGDADVLMWTGGFEEESFILLKKYIELGLDLPIIGVDILIAGERRELAETIDAPIYTVEPVVSKEFIDKFEAEYGREPHQYTDIAYDGVMMLVEAIQNTDGSHQAVIEYMRNDLEYEGYFTNYNFDENGDNEGGEWEIREFK